MGKHRNSISFQDSTVTGQGLSCTVNVRNSVCYMYLATIVPTSHLNLGMIDDVTNKPNAPHTHTHTTASWSGIKFCHKKCNYKFFW